MISERLKSIWQAHPFAVSLLLSGLLSACAHTEEMVPPFDPAEQARIRVFHGLSAYLYLGNICDGNIHPVIHAAAGGFSFLTPNRTIGMPPSGDTPRSYHEYVVPAGQPVTVKMFWQAQNAAGAWTSCGPIHMMFTPEAGQDYETFMSFRGGACQGVEVRQFTRGTDGLLTTVSAELNGLPFRYCR